MATLTALQIVNSINEKYSGVFLETHFLVTTPTGDVLKPVGTRLTITDDGDDNLYMMASSVTVSDIKYYIVRAITSNEWFIISHITRHDYDGAELFTADVVEPIHIETIGSDVTYTFKYDNAQVSVIFNG